MTAMPVGPAAQTAARDALAAVTDDSGLIIPRIARKPHRCRRADLYRPGWYILTCHEPGRWGKSYRLDRAAAEKLADGKHSRYPDAIITIGQDRNPDYSADCLSPDIYPGTVYGEYVGEAAAFESGQPYCARCAAAVWPASVAT